MLDTRDGPVRVGDLAREDGDRLARGVRVVEWDVELVLDDHESGRSVHGGHGADHAITPTLVEGRTAVGQWCLPARIEPA